MRLAAHSPVSFPTGLALHCHIPRGRGGNCWAPGPWTSLFGSHGLVRGWQGMRQSPALWSQRAAPFPLLVQTHIPALVHCGLSLPLVGQPGLPVAPLRSTTAARGGAPPPTHTPGSGCGPPPRGGFPLPVCSLTCSQFVRWPSLLRPALPVCPPAGRPGAYPTTPMAGWSPANLGTPW